jgi:hypothetical protein
VLIYIHTIRAKIVNVHDAHILEMAMIVRRNRQTHPGAEGSKREKQKIGREERRRQRS